MNDRENDTTGWPDALEEIEEIEHLAMCGRCYAEVEEVFPATCLEKPEELVGVPLGQYHCPDCGAMVMAGLKHPPMCKPCVAMTHQGIDTHRAS